VPGARARPAHLPLLWGLGCELRGLVGLGCGLRGLVGLVCGLGFRSTAPRCPGVVFHMPWVMRCCKVEIGVQGSKANIDS
jgi:hypothetical protein